MRLTCSKLGVCFNGGAESVPALRDVSFDTAEGEFLAIVGPSGCGKTTLLRALAGLLPPTEGRIAFHPAKATPRVLMVFQEEGLFPWMTVLDNAAFGLKMQGVNRSEREPEARDLLSRFGLRGREGAYPGELSVGMKQRVAIVRSFLSHPDMLLMDEPFGALDAQTRLRLQRELLDFWEQRRRSVVFVTHDVDEAILLSDRILVLSSHPGSILAEHDVPLARPRDPAMQMASESLLLKRRILSQLDLPVAEEIPVQTAREASGP